ncbi:hypothetical protein J6V85_02545 [Candidatus Saccharibacteria bacterium]|nr:hypothetical protein [Candidatus Saccharibacteria bacterium]
MFERLMRKFVKFIDPKLEKYRAKKAPTKLPKYTPKTLEEFIGVLQRTPKTILSSDDRDHIAAVMSFDSRKVVDLMIPKEKMVFVHQKDFLGPLTLDKLYKSGYTNFPVVDDKDKVKGIIHTEALNALEIKKTDRAEKYLDKNVCYLHIDNSLQFAVEEIERTNSYYFLVLDSSDSLAGFFTVQMLLDYLLG